MLDEHLKPALVRQFRAPSDNLAVHEPAEDDALLPSPGDAYKAMALASNKSLTRLCIVMGKEGFRAGAKAYRFYQYVHLDSDTDFGFTEDGQQFTLRFAGQEPKELVVRGRNLLKCCDYIHLHRMSWIRVADRDFRREDGTADMEPVIRSIDIREWKPKESSR
jgi:hypothetical protein